MNALLTAFRQTAQSHRLVVGIYGLTLAMSLLAGVPMFLALGRAQAGSMAPDALLSGMNFTILSDFLHHNGAELWPVLGVAPLLGIAYTCLWVWLTGGIVAWFAQCRFQPALGFRVSDFVAVCNRFFGRMLAVTSLTWVVLGVCTLLVVGVSAAIGLSAENTASEPQLIIGVAAASALLAFVGSGVVCIGDVAKVLLVGDEQRSVLNALKQAARLVVRQPSRFWWPFVGVLLAGALLFAALQWVAWPTQTWLTMLLWMLAQQAVVAVGVFLKIGWLGTAYTSVAAVQPVPVRANA